MEVVSDPNPTIKGILRSPVDPASEMILEAFLHPGTVLLLAIILAVAYYLLLKEVRCFRQAEKAYRGSPDCYLWFRPCVFSLWRCAAEQNRPTWAASDAGLGGRAMQIPLKKSTKKHLPR